MKQRFFTFKRWLGIAPVTWGLVGFVFLSSVLINSILYLSTRQEGASVLRFSRSLVTDVWTTGGGDSWTPMYRMMSYLREEPDQPFYSAMFIDQGLKINYPPSSLLFVEPIYAIWSHEPLQYGVLNLASRLIFAANIVVVARILMLGMRRLPSANEVLHPRSFVVSLAITTVLALTFYPLVFSVALGQIQTWLSFLFSACVLAWMTDRKHLAGALAGLICIVKPQLGLLVVWALLRRQWQFSIGWVAVVGSLGILSLIMYGFHNHIDYLNALSFLSRHGESYHPNQSVNGLLHRLLFNGTNIEWEPTGYPPYHPWVHISTLVSGLLFIGVALFWRINEHAKASAVDLQIAGLSFTIGSPIAWEHHYGVLLPMFAVALPYMLSNLRWNSANGQRNGLIAMGVAYILTSTFYWHTNKLADTYWNVLQSYLFIGALIFLLTLYVLRNRLQHAEPEPTHTAQPSVSLQNRSFGR